MPDPVVTRRLLTSLRAVAEPVAERIGVEVVAIEVVGGPRPILRVSIDRVGGSTIDDCARVSRQLSPALDVADLLDAAYTLEVSTPGIERPLQRERDFVYFAGCTVRMKLFGMDARRRLSGVLLGCEDGTVRVRVGEEVRLVPLADVERAQLVLDLDQYARLGEGLHPIAQEGTP